jgi:hypothetical protein
MSPPRQQAPPTDDTDALWLPPPPIDSSCSVLDGSLQWLPAELNIITAACTTVTATPDSVVLLPAHEFCSLEAGRALQPEGTMSVCPAGHLGPQLDSNVERYSAEDETLTDVAVQVESTLTLIQRGVKLRKTISNDRSAPRLS